MTTLERMPPQNFDAETSVLGSILLDPNCMAEIRDIVGANDFYETKHRAIFEELVRFWEDGADIDPVTVKSVLAGRGVYYDGAEMLAIMESVPSAAHARQYAVQVRECAIKRNIITVAARAQEAAYDPRTRASDLLADLDTRALDLLERSSTDDARVDVSATASEIIESTVAGKKSRILTNVSAIDFLMGGLLPGTYTTVAALRGQGKSTFLMHMLRRFAAAGGKAAFVSLEMSKHEIVTSLLAADTRIDSNRLFDGGLSHEERLRLCQSGVVERIGNGNIIIEAPVGLTWQQFRSRAEVLVRKDGAKILFLDYLQILTNDTRKSIRENVVEWTRGIKQIARWLNVPIVVAAQLGREVEKEKRKPWLSDLRESATIEQDSDNVIFLHLPEEESDQKETRVELHAAKHRGGPTGRRTLIWNKATRSYAEHGHIAAP